MADHNDENRNTLNIAPLRLFRAEPKNSGKVTPKRSMQQLHKLLLIKDQDGLMEPQGTLCKEHKLQANHFCRSCVSMSLCSVCAEQHEHPTVEYGCLGECISAEAELLDSEIEQLRNKKELLGEQFTSLQAISERVLNSKRNLFSRIRKFVDEMESAADLQLNGLLASKRTELIAYEKTLRKLTCGDSEVLRQQLLSTDPATYKRSPSVDEAQEKCEVLLDRLRAFCYALRSPLVREVSLNLNSLEEPTDRTSLPPMSETTGRDKPTREKPVSRPESGTVRSTSVSSSCMPSTATLQKLILKNMVDSQRRQSNNPSSLMRTLNLISRDSKTLTLESQRVKFGEGRAAFFN